jgi:hypothetical protein
MNIFCRKSSEVMVELVTSLHDTKCEQYSSMCLIDYLSFHCLLIGRFTEVLERCSVAYPGIFSGGGGSTNSVKDKGQRERGSGGGSPLVRGSAEFANE